LPYNCWLNAVADLFSSSFHCMSDSEHRLMDTISSDVEWFIICSLHQNHQNMNILMGNCVLFYHLNFSGVSLCSALPSLNNYMSGSILLKSSNQNFLLYFQIVFRQNGNLRIFIFSMSFLHNLHLHGLYFLHLSRRYVWNI